MFKIIASLEYSPAICAKNIIIAPGYFSRKYGISRERTVYNGGTAQRLGSQNKGEGVGRPHFLSVFFLSHFTPLCLFTWRWGTPGR